MATMASGQFTVKETAVLVDFYKKNAKILQMKRRKDDLKKQKWLELVKSVNAVENNQRSIEQIKQKLKNIKQRQKRKNNRVDPTTSSNLSSNKECGDSQVDDEYEDPDSIEAELLRWSMVPNPIHEIPELRDPNLNTSTAKEMQSAPAAAHNVENVPGSGGGPGLQTQIVNPPDSPDRPDQLPKSLGQLLEPAHLTLMYPKDLKTNEELEIVCKHTSDGPAIASCTRRTRDNISKPMKPPLWSSASSFQSRFTQIQKRKSSGIQVQEIKLLREQVFAIKEQAKCFQSIQTVLSELVSVEKQKVQMMQATVAMQGLNTALKLKAASQAMSIDVLD